MSIPEQLTCRSRASRRAPSSWPQVELPAGVTLVSDPGLLVVNIVAAPTAEDLESEGGGESIAEQAAERRSGRRGCEGEPAAESE